MFPPQLRGGHPYQLLQVILGPLQGFCALARPVGVTGLRRTKQLPNLPDALLGEPHFGGQLAILL